jgi:hypothetical protein
MFNIYSIGTSRNGVSLEADINTIGVATSRAVTIQLTNAYYATEVACSTDATGEIPKQIIGDYSLLKGNYLSVLTKISLAGNDAAARAAEAMSIKATYILEGGEAGTQVYNNPIITYNDPDVLIDLIVDLK